MCTDISGECAALIMYFEEEGSKFPRNVGILVPDLKMSHSQKTIIVIATTMRILNLTGELYTA